MFRCLWPPERLVPYARLVEDAGLDELWVVEDCFWAGGIATAATALAATERITVGLGVAPAVVRNPTIAAMELAALARFHPGRFVPGIGHGVQDWMRQVGAEAPSPLAALTETIDAIRRLLRGEAVTMHGRHVHLDDVRLVHPVDDPPPVLAGVTGPRSLAAAGRVADGVLLPEYSSPAYVRDARTRVASSDALIATYAWFHVDDDREAAEAAMRRSMTLTASLDTQLAPLGLTSQDLAGGLHAAALHQLAVVGTPDDSAAAILALSDTGARTVIMIPDLDHAEAQVARLASDVVPLLR